MFRCFAFILLLLLPTSGFSVPYPLKSQKVHRVYFQDPESGHWMKNSADVQVLSYLGSGTSRLTYDAWDKVSSQNLVVKVYKDFHSRTFFHYAKDLDLQNLSEQYARKFNQALNQDLIHYVKAVVGETTAGEYVLIEPKLSGFTKYNNNNGYTNHSDEWGKLAQSFTHFTHMVSGGAMMVCDIQGFGGNLTDPGVHSHNGLGGSTDLGSPGMHSFFKTHQCNQYCRRLFQSLYPIGQTGLKPVHF